MSNNEMALSRTMSNNEITLSRTMSNNEITLSRTMAKTARIAFLLLVSVTLSVGLCLVAAPAGVMGENPLAHTAYAGNDGTDTLMRVNDFTGTLSDTEESALSRMAKDEEKRLSFDIVVYITNKTADIDTLARGFYEGNDCGFGDNNDGIILVYRPDDNAVSVYAEGTGAQYFDEDEVQVLVTMVSSKMAAGNSLSTVVNLFISDVSVEVSKHAGIAVNDSMYKTATSASDTLASIKAGQGGVAAGSTSAGTANTGSANTGANASSASGATTTKHTTAELDWYPADPKSFKDFHNDSSTPRVVDKADLLTSEEEAQLEAQLKEMRERLGYDFVFMTDVSSYGLDRSVYAADFYQFNGYGLGENYSGVIYFVCMEQGNRGYWTAARGDARTLLTEDNVNYMDDRTYDLFKSGSYSKAVFTQFDNLNILYTDGRFPFDWTGVIVVIVAAIIGGIVTGIRHLTQDKGRMKTVAKASTATAYVVGVHFTVKKDENLGTTVSRKRHIDTSSSSGGSSGGHSTYHSSYSSSGGASFSGGGRSF